jgi:putative membrane protein
MNGFMHPLNWFGFPFFGFWMFFGWIIFLAIGYIVYQDANKRGMNGLLWFILVILPMVGIIFLILYIVIRETTPTAPTTPEKVGEGGRALEILKERYVKGEITREEYLRMKDELEK